MPIYEYKCHRCGQKFEKRQSFSEEPLKTHEECGGDAERLISAPSLHFKGSGWYVTDYAKGGASPSTTNGSQESKPAASESKTETKTEAPKTEAPKTDSSPAPAKA
jgi:putative FmdB family regulatory protein